MVTKDVKTAYEFHPDHLDQRSFAKIASNYWQWLSFITFFFPNILLWIILNNVHGHGTYIIKPLTHKKFRPTDPTTWRATKVWEGYAVQADEAGTSQAIGEKPHGLNGGKHTPDRLGKRSTHGFLRDVIYFFRLNKKESVFFWGLFGCIAMLMYEFSGQHFRRLMYDFRFGIQMANVVLPCRIDFPPWSCAVVAIKKSGATLTKDHFIILQPTTPLPKTESGYHEASLTTIETATATTWGGIHRRRLKRGVSRSTHRHREVRFGRLLESPEMRGLLKLGSMGSVYRVYIKNASML